MPGILVDERMRIGVKDGVEEGNKLSRRDVGTEELIQFGADYLRRGIGAPANARKDA